MLIGLCGYIGSGKDTCASILERTYHFKRIAFATPIKDIVSHLFGWNRLALEGSTEEDRIWREQVDPWWSKQLNLRITPRRMLQMIGTEMFRNCLSPHFWTTVVKRQIESLDPSTPIVVTDCRFPEEIEMIRSLGGIIVLVDRGLPEMIHSHSSEQYISSIIADAIIDNTLDLDHLESQLDTLIEYAQIRNLRRKSIVNN